MPPISPTSERRKSNRGRKLNPARFTIGNRAIDWITMPSVVPRPRRSIPKELTFYGVRFVPSTTRNRVKTPITTTLLMTGVHMLAPNRPLVFKIAPNSESIP